MAGGGRPCHRVEKLVESKALGVVEKFIFFTEQALFVKNMRFWGKEWNNPGDAQEGPRRSKIQPSEVHYILES